VDALLTALTQTSPEVEDTGPERAPGAIAGWDMEELNPGPVDTLGVGTGVIVATSKV